MDLTINFSFRFYSSLQSNRILVNYGDGVSKTYQINQSKNYVNKFTTHILHLNYVYEIGSLQTYKIPSSMASSNYQTMTGTKFLLLNTEYQFSANLYGFELFAANAGSIEIQVIEFLLN